ncbi:hypothetical protein C0995_004508 [Termitomyces sp. Mi166|nr:hypothetical protein C0995_004508 [Termitomyces sp. Mi166\
MSERDPESHIKSTEDEYLVGQFLERLLDRYETLDQAQKLQAIRLTSYRDKYLVLTVKDWENSGKYHHLCIERVLNKLPYLRLFRSMLTMWHSKSESSFDSAGAPARDIVKWLSDGKTQPHDDADVMFTLTFPTEPSSSVYLYEVIVVADVIHKSQPMNNTFLAENHYYLTIMHVLKDRGSMEYEGFGPNYFGSIVKSPTEIAKHKKEYMKGAESFESKLREKAERASAQREVALERAKKERERAVEKQKRAMEEQKRAMVEHEKKAMVERERAMEERERAMLERERTMEGQGKAIQKREKAMGERERTMEEREKIMEERERAMEERKRATLEWEKKEFVERERIMEGRERTIEEREKAAEGRERAVKERERVLEEREGLEEKQRKLQDFMKHLGRRFD